MIFVGSSMPQNQLYKPGLGEKFVELYLEKMPLDAKFPLMFDIICIMNYAKNINPSNIDGLNKSKLLLFTLLKFLHQVIMVVSRRSLSASESPQVSRTLLSILTVFNNAVVWKLSTYPLISNSSSSFNNTLGIIPSATRRVLVYLARLFLAMSKFFRVRFRLFVAWSVHTVVFRPIFFWLFLLRWCSCFLCCFWSL